MQPRGIAARVQRLIKEGALLSDVGLEWASLAGGSHGGGNAHLRAPGRGTPARQRRPWPFRDAQGLTRDQLIDAILDANTERASYPAERISDAES